VGTEREGTTTAELPRAVADEAAMSVLETAGATIPLAAEDEVVTALRLPRSERAL
jgi:hypothetical protein